jgi:hypothetical protein
MLVDPMSRREDGALQELMKKFRACPLRVRAEKSVEVSHFLLIWEKIHRQFWNAFKLGQVGNVLCHPCGELSMRQEEKDFEKKLVQKLLLKRRGSLCAVETAMGSQQKLDFEDVARSIAIFDEDFMRLVEVERNKLRQELVDSRKRNNAQSAYMQNYSHQEQRNIFDFAK